MTNKRDLKYDLKEFLLMKKNPEIYTSDKNISA